MKPMTLVQDCNSEFMIDQRLVDKMKEGGWNYEDGTVWNEGMRMSFNTWTEVLMSCIEVASEM